MAYATIEDLQARSKKEIPKSEYKMYNALLEDASVLIDAVNLFAKEEAKKVVSCNMVLRAISSISSDVGVPAGATQGSMSGMGYAQSWTISGGSVGEMYLTKVDRKLLGASARIGARSPLEGMV
ncbi:MAG: hypothetical protein MJ116_02885 [Lachnospiraceae bacterium]|nr:hypothetical protein [Lachnospiraceae bacterium]